MRIRYSELFTSFQGEANFTGVPTVWLRLFGCNLECRGFGQDNPRDPSTYVDEYKTIDISRINRMEDMPVITKGCDSSYSWSAKFKHLATDSDAKTIASMMLDLCEKNFGVRGFTHPVTKNPIQVAFTGGEPMMQQKAILAILDELNQQTKAAVPLVTIETNGTKPLKDYFECGVDANQVEHLHFAVSPKLFSVSGEQNAVDFDVIKSYASIADTMSVKFVMNGTKEAWDELTSYEHRFSEIDTLSAFWIMPVGATSESQSTPEVAYIADEAMRRGYNVAARVHAYVYGNQMGK